jgi:AraC-like DNA-binding protein
LTVASTVQVSRFSTEDVPLEGRYQAWLNRDWPRTELIYRTEPTEPFNILMESASLGQTLFVRTEITAMTWERRSQDIRNSDFQPIIVTMMVRGVAEGDLDGRPFHEPAGTYHFHDLARPSLHGSTASLTYALVLPREVAKSRLGPIEDLHGMVVEGPMAKVVMDLAGTLWPMLESLTAEDAARFESAFLELFAAGAAQARPGAPERSSADRFLRTRAIEAIDQRFGLEKASSADLAQVLGVAPDQLAAAFREDGGLAAYLLGRRLDAARAALTGLDQAEPIGNIAHRLGFSDAAHLSRAFRQRFGLSPRAYRKLDGQDVVSG